MPVRPEQVLVPARFLATTGHLVAMLVVVYDSENIARLALRPGADLKAEEDKIQALVWSAIALFAVEFVGLFSGLSMFASGYNTLSTALHFTGMVLVGHFVNQQWRLDSFNYLFGFFSVLPSVMEAGLAAAFFRFKSRPYLPPQ